MRIKGKIFKKRSYIDNDFSDVNCIAFVEIDNGINVDGDTIRIIPILCDRSSISKGVGESIEVEGNIEFKSITTRSGKRNLSPVPVLRLTRTIS